MFKFILMSGVASIALSASLATTKASDELIRIASVPKGAEVTGPAVNGLGELFFNAQHPGGKSVLAAGGPAALIGYVDGLDIRTFAGPSMPIPADGDRNKVHVAAGNYTTLGKSGDDIGGGQKLGGIYTKSGDLMFISNDVDFNAFIPLSASSAYLYTAWEGGGRKGVAGISRLNLNRSEGHWRADLSASKMMDLSSIDGGWVLCYGTISPWGTPIFSEEYYFFNTSLWNHPNNHDEDERPGFAKGNDNMYHQPKRMNEYMGANSNPYRYGYNIEMNNAADADDAGFTRHYVMGRFSHENVVVMGDGRTVYQSDDDSAKYTDAKYNTNSGGVFFKFVADHKADLRAGTLYAAKLTQDDNADPATAGFHVDWVTLGHSTNVEVERWISEYENIGTDAYQEGSTNFIADADVINWAEGKTGNDINGDGTVGSYPDDRPAFLESRKAAAAMGATYEWNKLEGVTASDDTLYLAVSEITDTMDKSWGHVAWDTGARDEQNPGTIALNKENCGVVYGGKIGFNYNVTRLDPVVVGRTMEDGTCDPNGMARPDNILALSNGALLIGEDAGKKAHPVDMLWMRK